jgi:hypothetical protein
MGSANRVQVFERATGVTSSLDSRKFFSKKINAIFPKRKPAENRFSAGEFPGF